MDFIYNQIIADYNKITDRIYLGNIGGAQNKNFFNKNNIGYVINLANQSYPRQNNVEYLDIDISDSPNTDIKHFFPQIINFFNKGLQSNKNIYIHCRAGVSRSTTGLIAFLMSKGLTMKDAVNYVISKRNIIEPNAGFWIQLMIYERELYGKNSVGYKDKYY
jgi:atypical dual specificity phosphatase